MKYDRETLRIVFEADLNNELVLPDFQRDFVWKKDKQSKLLASILVGLPIGSFLIIKGKKDNFPARRLGFTEISTPKEECRFLLDGQQRLSCIKSIFDDLYPSVTSWRDVWNKLYGQLRYRWFLRVSPSDSSSEDVFGWERLKFANNLDNYDPEQVLDFIVCHQVLVKGEKHNDWYHPAYKIYDDCQQEITGDSQKRHQLAIEYSKRNLVPLFEIFSNNTSSSLHSLSLRQIANNRRELLKAEVQDKKFSIEEVLEEINPNIATINNSETLNENWYTLSSKWATEVQKALEDLLEQEILETVLPSSEIARAASIFETINEGGTPLSNFDLIVAKTAKTGKESLAKTFKSYIEEEMLIPLCISDSDSKDNWKMSSMKAIKDNSIVRFVTDEFLNLLSILCYQEHLDNNIDKITVEHIKRAKILSLDSTQINDNFRRTIKSLRKAFAFLQYRCGIVEVNDIRYRLMILPIAYLFSLSETNDEKNSEISDKYINNEQTDVWNDKKLINKIEYWYWSSLFSGRYKEKQNERCIQDVQYLYHWVINDDIASESREKITSHFQLISQNILNKQEYSDESTLLMKNQDNLPQKGIKYAILQYILSHEPKDFILQSSNNDTSVITKLKPWKIAQDNTTIEEHHIIPLSSATTIGESSKRMRDDKNHLLNSPLNLSYISREANRTISDLRPKIYLTKLTNATLSGHEISPSFIKLISSLPETFKLDYYQSILKERFDTLKRVIQTELESLIDQD